MFAREAADPRGSVSQITGGGRVVQTLQVVGGAKHWGHTVTTISAVASSLVTPVPGVEVAVVSQAVVDVSSLGLGLTQYRQQQQGGRCEEDGEEGQHPGLEIVEINNNSHKRGSVKTQVAGKFNRDDLPRCLYNESAWQTSNVLMMME